MKKKKEKKINISKTLYVQYSMYKVTLSLFENTVGIGEIACNKQFIFSHSVFNPFGELTAIVVCKLIQFWKV